MIEKKLNIEDISSLNLVQNSDASYTLCANNGDYSEPVFDITLHFIQTINKTSISVTNYEEND